ncbi:MAG: phosphoribosylformylglycinamidine cyclo-ligase, partial [SAR324 cluster bacterium]|nr:phosphoribosylformylglycinamidine cyclo-ligase [SAR324 cluster bacterium]
SGISEGCRQSNCALIGGETAEMPGMYSGEDYDLAGFAVGVVEKEKLINGEKILPGDQLIGLPSSGIHSNGFSLVRKILEDNSLHLNQSMDAHVSSGQKTLGEVLLEPTRIYVRPLLKLMQTIPIKGMVHVTGGGLPGNLPRMLPEGVAVELDSGSWENLPVFDWLQEKGNLSQEEMLPVFNMGIGFVICLSPEHLDQVFSILHQEGEQPVTIGKVISGNRNVIIH